MPILTSASDVRGTDRGGGDVDLSWFHPDDILVQGIVFDVYATPDIADPFRTCYAPAVAALSTSITGRNLAGELYFTVVARRGDALALPSRSLLLPVAGPVASVPSSSTGLPRGGADAPTGVGFPFGITPAGGVYAQGGDALLRGKILQLLLTSPGERVNRPDYGTRLLDLVFDPNSEVLAATTEFMINRALQQYFADEIQVDRVQLTTTDDALLVDISYMKKTDLRVEQVRVGLPLPGLAA
jgi:phage baseplate assembly protein W